MEHKPRKSLEQQQRRRSMSKELSQAEKKLADTPDAGVRAPGAGAVVAAKPKNAALTAAEVLTYSLTH